MTRLVIQPQIAPDFKVEYGPVKKSNDNLINTARASAAKKKKPTTPPGHLLNMANFGNAAKTVAPNLSKEPPAPSSPKTKSGTPARSEVSQTRSPASNTQEKQFGKHRGKPTESASPYFGTHRAPGKHEAKPAGRHGLNVNQGNPDYKPTHSRGAHGRNYNAAADINSVVGEGKRKEYIPKHTAQGQATRAKQARQQARQISHDKLRNKIKSVHKNIHQLTHGSKHYTEHLRAMETKP